MKNIRKEILLCEGQQIVFSHVVGSNVVPEFNRLHLHNEFELYVYVCGDVDFIIGDQYITLSPGNVILARENTLHHPIVKSSRNYERFYIMIPREVFSNFKYGTHPMDFLKSDLAILTMEPDSYRVLLNLLNRISDACSQEDFRENYLIYAYLLEIFKLVNDNALNEGESGVFHQAQMPELVKKVLNYVDGHAGEVDCVNALAEHFFVNAAYLSRLFAQVTRISLKHYLVMRKIALAKKMLMKGHSVTEVAYNCGFSSSSHFISVFKKNTGQTPDKYRKGRG